jgi:hypothetical protein
VRRSTARWPRIRCRIGAGRSVLAGFATDNGDENFVNDNGQTSGDIFTQNAQDQSTA